MKINCEPKKPWQLPFYWVVGFVTISILASLFIILFMYLLDNYFSFASALIGDDTKEAFESFIKIIRDLAWVFWVLLSLTGALIALCQNWRRGQIKQKQWETQQAQIIHKNLQERFEKATEMLGGKIELVCIAGCRLLSDIGNSDKSMRSQCVRLLFAFISNPPLTDEKKGKPLAELFPVDKPLRPDIQEAVNSFSAIYKYYDENGIDHEVVNLPSYFWQNKKKGKIFLIRASLWETDLRKADLPEANLQGAHMWRANLQKANLSNANLEAAFLHEANIQKANLYFANLSRAYLYGANLEKADLQRALMLEANLEAANLQGANLPEAILSAANLRKANLREAILPDATLGAAELRYADLQNAYLLRAGLRSANLQSANLQGADLEQANLWMADLERANLEEANISVADMRETKNLTKEQILSAKWRGIPDEDSKFQRYSQGRDRSGVPPKLPEYLLQDDDIKEWLETPAYDDR